MSDEWGNISGDWHGGNSFPVWSWFNCQGSAARKRKIIFLISRPRCLVASETSPDIKKLVGRSINLIDRKRPPAGITTLRWFWYETWTHCRTIMQGTIGSAQGPVTVN